MKWKIIRTAWLQEGYIYDVETAEEAIEKAIKEWGIKRETIVGAVKVME